MSATLPTLTVSPHQGLNDLLSNADFRSRLAQVVGQYLPRARWFTDKGREIHSCRITHHFALSDQTAILVLAVQLEAGPEQLYQLPIAYNWEPEWLDNLRQFNDHLAIAELQGGDREVILSDAVPRASFRKALFGWLAGPEAPEYSVLSVDRGSLLQGHHVDEPSSRVPALDTSNTAIIYQDRYFYKLFRKLGVGLNPDLELTRYLSEETDFKHSPRYAGSLSIGRMSDENFINLGICIGKIDNQGDAWQLFQEFTRSFYSRVIDYGLEHIPASPMSAKGYDAYQGLPKDLQKLIDPAVYERTRLLGKRSAQMHEALAAAPPDRPELTPEPMSEAYRHEISQAAGRLFERQLSELTDRLDELPAQQKELAERVIQHKQTITNRLDALARQPVKAMLTRIHGDYHLGQVLYDESDFYIIDFEGEPLLSIADRRRKRPPFKDVAGMVRSLHYASRSTLINDYGLGRQTTTKERGFGSPTSHGLDPAEVQQLSQWGNWWFRVLSSTYMQSYYDTLGDHALLPERAADRELLLDLFTLEKAVYEVAYELNSRPDWLDIPLQGLLFALEPSH